MNGNKEVSLNENKISSNYIMTKALKYNIRFLEAMANRSKQSVKDKVQQLADLYKERRISNITTASNMIDKLRAITPKTEKRVLKQFDKLIAKYENKEPLNVRMQQAKEARILSKKQATYQVYVSLYSDEKRFPKQKPYKGVYHICDKQFEVKAPNPFPKELLKVLVNHRMPLWTKGFNILKTSEDFLKFIHNKPEYVKAFKFLSYDTLADDGKKYDPLDEGLQDASNVSCNFKYIHTPIDLDSKTFMESIQNERYTKNECWINSITDFYGDTLMSTGRKRNVLTREKLLTILNKTEESVKDGISVNEVLPFFKQYKLNLRVLDAFGRLICRHDNETRNTNNKTMFCMVKGNHVYTLNYNLQSLDQKLHITPEFNIKASSDYYFGEEREDPKYRMISHIDELVELIKKLTATDAEEVSITLNIIYLGDKLTDLLYQILEAGYDPSIKYESGRISQIGLIFGCKIKAIVLIRAQQLAVSEHDGECDVPNAEIYNNMTSAMNKFHKSLFKPEHMSYYSKQDVDILDEYRTIVPAGLLEEVDVDVIEIDVSKAFTFAFSQITEIPTFNEFDCFQLYNNEPIALNNLYVVKPKQCNLFFNKTFNLCYGKFLVHFKDVEILAFKAPSFVKKVDYNKIVQELYNTKIDDDEEMDKYCKKLIANVNCGLLEKSTNKAQRSMIFKTLSEARYQQGIYGGKISVLKRFTEETVEEVDPLDFGLEVVNSKLTTEVIEDDKKYYLLTVCDSATLNNGFRYIKELLLQIHNFRMYTDYNKLVSLGVKVYSVKTDAFTIRFGNLYTIMLNLPHMFNSQIGGWRFSKFEDVRLPTEFYKCHPNTEVKITVPTFERLELKDEWNTDEMCDLFEDKKRVMIRADLPGSGKSYACEKMQKRGHKVLFVCPTNKLVQKYGDSGITLNKFFSIGMTSETKMAKFDDSSFDVVVFDEIYFYDVPKFARIKRYCLDNPDKIIIATGDTSQLEPISSLSNQLAYDVYSDFCINQIFSKEMFLKENKRLKSDEDKLILKQIKADVFNQDIPIIETINKYFQFSETQSSKNIAYKNNTCKEVALKARKQQNKTTEYEVGEFLVCREYCKMKKLGITFNVNFEYEILKVKENELVIKDVSNTETYTVPLETIRTHFIFNYCSTCHSCQGSSIDEEITIFDYKFVHASRKWLWTAITRATELKNVYFFKYEEVSHEQAMMKSYFEKKILGYKSQDKAANRQISKDYVNVKWFMDAMNSCCSKCACSFNVSLEGGWIGDFSSSHGHYVKSNITADRIRCDEDHNLDNVQPMCYYCNCSKSNK